MSYKIKYTSVICLLIFGLSILFSQDNNQLATNLTKAGDPNESQNGYWQLIETKSDIRNSTRIASWSGFSENLNVTATWKDSYEMVHTLEFNYKWDTPPSKMFPGKDYSLKSNYTNIDFSTTAKLNMGIKMIIDKIGPQNSINYESIEIMKLSKDFKNRLSEQKSAFFVAPKYFKGDNENIEFIIDCFVGKDHFTTTYIYRWTE